MNSILNSIFVDTIKKGSITRFIGEDIFVGIVDFYKNGKFVVLTQNTNCVADLFIESRLIKREVNFSYKFEVPNREEFISFQTRLKDHIEGVTNRNIKYMFIKILKKVEEHCNGCEKLTKQLIKNGFKKYPLLKINIFNGFTCKGCIGEEPSFEMNDLLLKTV